MAEWCTEEDLYDKINTAHNNPGCISHHALCITNNTMHLWVQPMNPARTEIISYLAQVSYSPIEDSVSVSEHVGTVPLGVGYVEYGG